MGVVLAALRDSLLYESTCCEHPGYSSNLRVTNRVLSHTPPQNWQRRCEETFPRSGVVGVSFSNIHNSLVYSSVPVLH